MFKNADPHFPQAKLRGLKVLPPHGVWVTEAKYSVGKFSGSDPATPRGTPCVRYVRHNKFTSLYCTKLRQFHISLSGEVMNDS